MNTALTCNKIATLLLGLIVIATTPTIATSQETQKKKQAEQESVEKCQLPEVREELAERVNRDQEARKAMIDKRKESDGKFTIDPELHSKLMKIDAENTQWLKEQVEKHGWLGKTLVGERGAYDAWLLVQHADQKPKFQRHCLDLMTAMPDGEVDAKNLAYLTDRVLKAEGKPQRYGTQMSIINGEPTLGDVEDIDNLDKRRGEVGLVPIDEYIQRIKKTYSLGSSKSNKKSQREDR